MSEQRIGELERLVGDLRVEVASNQHLKESVDRLAQTVSSLEASLNKGRGALWGLGAMASVIGGCASFAASKLFGAA